MSFLTVLKSIGSIFTKVTTVVQPLEPVIGVVPGGVAFNTIFNSVVAVEQLFDGMLTGVPANPAVVSAAKKQIATQVITSTLPTGVTAPSPDVVSSTIDQIVAGLNTLAAAHASATK